MNWWDHALCLGADPDIFFPYANRDFVAAKKICDACPVRLECLTDALEDERGFASFARYGMRGALTPVERAKLDHSMTKKKRRPSLVVIARPWNRKKELR